MNNYWSIVVNSLRYMNVPTVNKENLKDDLENDHTWVPAHLEVLISK